MKTLEDLLFGSKTLDVKGDLNIQISFISFDSRKVQGNSLFIATVGTQSDGHSFIAKAIEDGAIAIVCEKMPSKRVDGITYVKVKNSQNELGIIASNFYDNPSSKLKLVGITGTNGKTTTATLLYQLFSDLGYNVGLISTVENRIIDEVIASTHTTPDPISLNRLLRAMLESGCTHTFMEVSSHAIVQRRISGLTFTGGVFTNISHDHLDFHETFDNYIEAKKMFFDELPSFAFALSNADDKRGKVMLQNTKAHKKYYSLQMMAEFKARILENQFSGLLLNIDGQETWFKLVGSFNAYNLLAVYATAILLEEEKQTILTSLSNLKGAEGRFDYFISPNMVVGIVDYAHTPDALKNVLHTIKDIKSGNEKIITIVGCGGDRDKSKRPIMAEVASKLSDKVIITTDNPRTENPEQIIKEMMEGISISNKRKTLQILDRREAIRTACHLANKGDIILLAGKGHEKYQEINGVKYSFNDKEILENEFKNI